MDWLDNLLALAMEAVNQRSAAAIVTLFFIVALTEAGIPFPFILDSVLFFTSYKAGPLSDDLLIVFLVVFCGRQFGSSAVYWLTRFLGAPFINWLAKRFHNLPRNLERFKERLSHNAIMAIAIPRLTGLLTLISVTAGTICLPYHYFVLGVALSALIFDGGLILLGFIFREGFKYLGFYPEAWQVIVVLVAVICVIWMAIHFSVRRRSST
jgi:membrane protein DedA with SNARE-associated domain